jgi:phosphoribosylformylglycinamidine synthase
MTEIEIRVGLKPGMADPEGANVQKALGLLGFESVEGVKSARCYRVLLELPEAEALKEAERMCQRLLANPVVHDYSLSVVE